MNPDQRKSLKEQWTAFAAQAKALVSKEFTLADFKPAKIKLQLQVFLQHGKRTALELPDAMKWPERLTRLLMAYRKQLVSILLGGVLLLMSLWVLEPYEKTVQDRLLMRPSQWAYLQNLLKESKTKAMPAGSVAMFNEAELQKCRAALLNLGVKPTVLRLTADNPPRIELQANDVLFSTLMDFLEVMRSTWHAYPVQINLQATDSAAMVNVSMGFLQYSNTNVTNLSGVPSQ